VLKFGPPEFFAVYLLTFCSSVGLGRKEKHKTRISMALGLLLAGVGMDTVSGQLRMTFAGHRQGVRQHRAAVAAGKGVKLAAARGSLRSTRLNPKFSLNQGPGSLIQCPPWTQPGSIG
jgi:hypothetical protein